MFKTHPSAEAYPFNNLNGLSVAYINYEGTELPLKNTKDFEGAIKLAKSRGKDHLDLIFYDGTSNPNDTNALNDNKCAILGTFSRKQSLQSKNTLVNNSSCPCVGDPPPEWFKQHMKKFKKELLKDLRSNISEIVHEELEKEKKLAEAKQFNPVSEKNEFSSLPKLGRKKKLPDTFDLLEKREMKLIKKIEKLHSSKFDRLIYPVLYLEKLENKARTLLEERKKLLERGRQGKLKDAKRTWEPEKKYTHAAKSALFRENDVFLTLQPGAEFSVTVNVLNNGTLAWVAPRMESLYSPAIFLNDIVINLPKLEPGQSVDVTIRGRITQRVGNYYFAYKLIDGSDEFGPLFSCFAVVSDSQENVPTNHSEKSNSEGNVARKKRLTGTLIELKRDVIANGQKSIKGNIIEIEKKLHNIDLLRPCSGRKESIEVSSGDDAIEFEVRGCDLPQGKERKPRKDILEVEMIFGVDSSEQKGKFEKSKVKDENVAVENFETKNDEVEMDSDSEISVIIMPEEDENFIFVPVHSEISSSERVNKTEKKGYAETGRKSDETIIEECPVKVEMREVESDEFSLCKECFSSPSCPPVNAILTDDEEFSNVKRFEPIIVSTKSASDSSDQNLRENVAGNVSVQYIGSSQITVGKTKRDAAPTGIPVFTFSPGEASSSRNTKAGEKRNHEQSTSRFVLHLNQQDVKRKNTERKNQWNKNVPISDSLGRPIYVVRYDGYCLPLEDLILNKRGVPDVEMGELREDTQTREKEELNANKGNPVEAPAVNIIPNVLMNGASRAFNTAKSMINTLQSALKTEVEIPSKECKKDKQPAEFQSNFPFNLYSMGTDERNFVESLPLANQMKYFDAMLTLLEMGFENFDQNFRLLMKHDCEVFDVIYEILDM